MKIGQNCRSEGWTKLKSWTNWTKLKVGKIKKMVKFEDWKVGPNSKLEIWTKLKIGQLDKIVKLDKNENWAELKIVRLDKIEN